jgi:hypothetical protein
MVRKAQVHVTTETAPNILKHYRHWALARLAGADKKRSIWLKHPQKDGADCDKDNSFALSVCREVSQGAGHADHSGECEREDREHDHLVFPSLDLCPGIRAEERFIVLRLLSHLGDEFPAAPCHNG